MKSKASHSFPLEHSLSLVVIFLLALCIAIEVMAVVLALSQIPLLSKQVVTEADNATNDVIQAIPAIARLAAYLITGVLFLVWIYRVHKNLPALGVVRPRYSPGWAVGWFFVPFMNLVRPYEVVRELWKDSNPDVGLSDTFFKQHPQSIRHYPSRSRLIGLWWGCWIASLIAERASLMLLSGPEAATQAGTAMLAGIVSDCLGMIGVAIAILIVREIDTRQEEKHRRLIVDRGLQDQPAAAH